MTSTSSSTTTTPEVLYTTSDGYTIQRRDGASLRELAAFQTATMALVLMHDGFGETVVAMFYYTWDALKFAQAQAEQMSGAATFIVYRVGLRTAEAALVIDCNGGYGPFARMGGSEYTAPEPEAEPEAGLEAEVASAMSFTTPTATTPEAFDPDPEPAPDYDDYMGARVKTVIGLVGKVVGSVDWIDDATARSKAYVLELERRSEGWFTADDSYDYHRMNIVVVRADDIRPYPHSFKSRFGREPIPGQDYDAHAPLDEDLYQYLTGTGIYAQD